MPLSAVRSVERDQKSGNRLSDNSHQGRPVCSRRMGRFASLHQGKGRTKRQDVAFRLRKPRITGDPSPQSGVTLMALTISQASRYEGNDWWKWSVWLEGPKAELD